MSEPRKLKKYPNRRLYDFERHCYVCLDDVRALIAANQEVHITENETSNDITRDTLMQVVMLLEDADRPLFSQGFLTQLIQCHALDADGALGRYLDECMRAFAAGKATPAPPAHSGEASDLALTEQADSTLDTAASSPHGH
jgi:polyhydroxyalkanoate synthesis repressor PhaR